MLADLVEDISVCVMLAEDGLDLLDYVCLCDNQPLLSANMNESETNLVMKTLPSHNQCLLRVELL